MSRFFDNTTVVELDHEATAEDIRNAELVYAEEWTGESADVHGAEIAFRGSGSLCGGCGEEQAHANITNAMRRALGKCRVSTVWTCIDDAPTNEYVTDADDEPDDGKPSRASGGSTADIAPTGVRS